MYWRQDCGTNYTILRQSIENTPMDKFIKLYFMIIKMMFCYHPQQQYTQDSLCCKLVRKHQDHTQRFFFIPIWRALQFLRTSKLCNKQLNRFRYNGSHGGCALRRGGLCGFSAGRLLLSSLNVKGFTVILLLSDNKRQPCLSLTKKLAITKFTRNITVLRHPVK